MEIYIGIGTNLGNREENIVRAIEEMGKFCKILKKSQIYETTPVGFLDQDDFLNLVVQIETSLEPQNLLKELKKIEKKLGRKDTVRFGPRIIDLDILFYDDIVFVSENLQIPHKRMHERKFVLVPMCDIASSFVHPKFNKTCLEIYKELDTDEIVKLYK
jgi:2-amino-4-hydroxy-6-hydroxymethyldihydropteridine diphosphokinase